MRILHIISSAASGGAEIYVRDLSVEMMQSGNHQIFLLFIDRAVETGRDLGFEKDFLNSLEKNGIEYGFLGQSSRKKPLKGILKLRDYCKKWQPDVVHSHLYYAALFSMFLSSKKLFYTHHNARIGASKYIYKILDLRMSGYVGICSACEELLSSISRRPVFRIDNGVPLSRVIIKQEYPNNNPVQLVYVGRLTEQKNLSLLLKSLARLSHLRFKLKIVGEGSKKSQLIKLVKELSLEGNVEFLGTISAVKQVLSDSDIFVMSSDWEGLPIAQIEATLAGLPVLVTDVGGCSEIVNTVDNGLVVKPHIDEYTPALEKLISDYSLRLFFHNNALKNSAAFEISSSVKEHLRVYNIA